MVGVAGKSKGCHTCRRRKIRCDQGKPTCGQCLRSHRHCEGYVKPRVFLNTFLHQVQRSATPAPPVQNQVEKPSENLSPQELDAITAASLHHQTTEDEINEQSTDLYQLQLFGSKPTVPRLIGLEHLQPDQALRDFLACTLPVSAQEDVPLEWLSSVLNLSKDLTCLPLATSALSYGWKGRVEEAPVVVYTARSYYVSALQFLHKALCDDPASQSDAILATMECLALYEIFEFGTEAQTGWLAHLSGVETLIKLRGPQMHIAGFGHKMFKFFRMIGIYKAIINRKATFLADSEWKHIPWTLSSKNISHQYLDFAAELPGILERVDILTFSSAPTLPNHQTVIILLQDINTLLERMNLWLDNSDIKVPAGPPHMRTPRQSKSYSQSPSPSSLHPPSTSKTLSSAHKKYILSPLAQSQSTNHHLKNTTNNPKPHGYPSASPQLLGVSFDTLATARLAQSIWSVQLTLYTSVFSSPVLRRHLPLTDPNTPWETLTREKGTALADKIALWSDYCGLNAWQSFGAVLAGFILRAGREWYVLDREWELRSEGERMEEGWRYSKQAELDKCIEMLGLLLGTERMGDS